MPQRRPRQSQWQQIQLNALIEETLILVQTAGLQARIAVITELDPSLPPIVADRELLKQVVLNILINAVQAIAARGEIRTWQYSASQQAVMIEDNGNGIDLAIQDKIFNPFFTTKAPDRGTGLGLYLVYNEVKRLGGTIAVESVKDSLTRFVVRFSGA